MKIRFLKNVSADVIKVKLGESWPKYFYRNTELLVDSITYSDDNAVLNTVEGDLIEGVPIDSFEKVQETSKNPLTFLL